MLNLRRRQKGVTLIELMIALALFGLLTALAAPNFMGWIQNQQIRAGAESILNGIQLARRTAVNNNTWARFNLCNTTFPSVATWQVLVASSAAATPDAADTFGLCGAGLAISTGNEVRVQEHSYMEGAKNAQVTTSSIVPTLPITIPITNDSSTSVMFNGLGQLIANDAAVGGNPIRVIEVSTANGRPLLVTVQQGGSVKMCDPSPLLAATDPRHC